MQHIDPKIIEKAKLWTTDFFDSSTRNEIEKMLLANDENLVDAFYKDLEFGTGGMRGIMGVGTNRMNKYTVGMATQGFANYIKEVSQAKQLRVVIAYDCRHNSPEFAEICADVFSGNGFEVLIFESLRPTPELSFAIRHHNCDAGVMITASHNPKEYNGYKAYWNDGAQLVPPHDLKVVEHARKIKNISEVKWNRKKELVKYVGKDTDAAYLNKISELSLLDEKIIKKHENFPVVFSPLHGTGTMLIPTALKEYGFKNIISVKDQSVPDGNFSTVTSPNPEEDEALKMAIQLGVEKDAKLVMATDPDSDRVGIAVRNDNDEFVLLNGNETAAIFIYYLLEQWKSKDKITGEQYIVKTIVTTHLIDEIAKSYGVDCYNVLTGFKYIAELIGKLENQKEYIAGGEESYGLLAGDFVRDKDAVGACCVITEAAVWAKENSLSLYQLLKEIHKKFGVYREKLFSITKKGGEGAKEIKKMMENFRDNPPNDINGVKVSEIVDYQAGFNTNIITGETKKTFLPKSNVIQFLLEDGSLITLRPSGTEPKIKFYFSVNDRWDFENRTYEESIGKLDQKIADIITSMKLGF